MEHTISPPGDVHVLTVLEKSSELSQPCQHGRVRGVLNTARHRGRFYGVQAEVVLKEFAEEALPLHGPLRRLTPPFCEKGRLVGSVDDQPAFCQRSKGPGDRGPRDSHAIGDVGSSGPTRGVRHVQNRFEVVFQVGGDTGRRCLHNFDLNTNEETRKPRRPLALAVFFCVL